MRFKSHFLFLASVGVFALILWYATRPQTESANKMRSPAMVEPPQVQTQPR